MKFGLTPEQDQYIVETAVKPLEVYGASVWCYGSRARGDYTRFSDLDLMAESEQDLTKVIGNIREKLETSNFPYKVDLVLYMDFAESYKTGYKNDRIRFA